MQEPTENAHWRDSAREARFLFIDAAAAIPLLIFLVHIRMWTFVVASLMIAFLAILKRFGYSVTVFARIFRSFLAGPRKMAIPWWKN